ncbi:MAG: PocR ligand-binding domain-containing protein [Bacteroidetes bacterium]|nr:PocR ligand-binding domain-containing protein [Bacteroidota bacterium]
MQTEPYSINTTQDASQAVRFGDIFNVDDIQRLQDLFSDAIGIASIITHPDGTPVTKPSNFCRLCADIIRRTEKGLAKCQLSDAVLGRQGSEGPVVQQCLSCGLWDAGAAITVGGMHIGNWLIGQVRIEESDDAGMLEYADDIGAKREDFAKALGEVPFMSSKRFNKVAAMLFAYANILSENAYDNLQLKKQIKEREKVVEALLESEEQYRDLVENSPDAIAIYVEGKVRLINKECLHLMAASSSEELIGKPVIEFVHPDYRAMVTERMRMAAIHGTVLPLNEEKFIRIDGSSVEVEVKAMPIKLENKPAVQLIIRDITTRKHIEKTISMLAHAIRSISECVSITDMTDKIVFVNNAFQQTYQYEENELLGKSISMVRSPDNSPAIVEEILPATLHGGWQGELLNRRKDGSEFPVFVSSSVVRDDYGEPIALIGVTNDITARKIAEKELIDINEELDRRVKQRTAELEAANKELETFSYSVSHDLKTPLRHISGFIGLFLENKSTDLTEEELGYLKRVSGSVNNMALLIDAILSFSRLNQAELRKATIRSSEMVKQVISFYEPDIHDRQITFNVAPLTEIKGDEELIRQVWTNLISNAIKYTGKKQNAVVDIGCFSTDTETTFFVKDNGAGFNMKYADKLFGVFQRLHKSRDFDGIGIGLANVNRIVSRHGGHCHAEGEPDQGATFYFSLPG